MKVIIEFDLEVSGNLSDDQLKKIFFQRIQLADNIISDEETFEIVVAGWSLKDERENNNA